MSRQETNEKLIIAFLTGKSHADIARKAEVNRGTVAKYAKDPEFMAKVKERRLELSRAEMGALALEMPSLTNEMIKIAKDKLAPYSARVSAYRECRSREEYLLENSYLEDLMSIEKALNDVIEQ